MTDLVDSRAAFFAMGLAFIIAALFTSVHGDAIARRLTREIER